ncbi:MAG: tRNA (adenosine(37)-N6)-threonylcarbamoyltransferase complex transferase subunit TsaD [Pseudobdellovibrionaceae bacterium]|nr:tRNA (adenosine(37)-N6)-threonylcarbamoyltransferase complex transferase subunit TsaD [Bdellovibrionales bacterium]USN46431.1 MAG: tRNA (adenosine(37)-N6)-threonylcarbamoyltransferase complex transferase subunit TsaD [Pseudobdellovibrionaceae bacterium]
MIKFENVLAVETSCDDTSVSIVRNDGFVRAVISANQDSEHKPFGGIVPEIASRNHTLHLLPLIEVCLSKANMNWSQIDGLVVTSRPGLVGSLLVGLVAVKTLALAKGLPFLGVNHLEAHLLAPFLRDEGYQPPDDFDYPYIGLAVSGGHTHLYHVTGLGEYRVLGKTIDDAAGEAFDKFAKMVGLGFPGGVKVDKLSKEGRRDAFVFPRPLVKEDNFNYSFSGLKTSAQRLIAGWDDHKIKENLHDLCASYQEAIVDSLMAKLDRAVVQSGLKRAVLTGGVSANFRLREAAGEWADKMGVQLVVPPLRYCTDNAAMVGYAGIQRLNRGEVSAQDLGPSAHVYPDDFIDE